MTISFKSLPDGSQATIQINGIDRLFINGTTGALTLPGNATNPLEAAPKQQVESTVSSAMTNVVKTNVSNTFTAQQVPMSGVLVDGATINWNGDANGQVVSLTLGGNRTMAAPTNIKQYALYILRVTQSGGSNTITWNAAFKFGGAGAPSLTTTAGKTDILSFIGGAGNTLEYLGIRKDAV